MTVGIMARFMGGYVAATDSAITTGNNRITLPHIKGQYILEGFTLWAGGLALTQKMLARAQTEELLDVILDEKDELDEDDGGAEFLLLRKSNSSMTILDQDGASYSQEDYAAIGHGSDGARMMLRGMYACAEEDYVTQTLQTIVKIIQEFDNTVYGPVRTAVFYD
jgi:hypothetical protein